jgi:hypothetical protein
MRLCTPGEIIDFAGTPNVALEPLDDNSRARMIETKRRGKFHGLPHRLGGGTGNQVQRGQKLADSHEATK